MNYLNYWRPQRAALVCALGLWVGALAAQPLLAPAAAPAAPAAFAAPTAGTGAMAPSGQVLQLPGMMPGLVPRATPSHLVAPAQPAVAEQSAPTLLTDPTQLNHQPQAPSLFQGFVQQTTGRLLPVFGVNLFSQPATFAPVTNIVPPADYVLGPGDQVQLHVWGGSEMALTLTLDRQGQVMVPRAGPLNLGGVRVEQLESVLRQHVGRIFTHFELSASVSQLRSIQVYVVGQARQPGIYTLSSLSTLINAVFASGGPNAQGSMRNITLQRGGRSVATVDLYRFITQGDRGQDQSLQSGDVIVIAPVGPQVAVTGALDQAAIFEIKPNETVNDLLRFAGASLALADQRVALLERIDPQQQPARQVSRLGLGAASPSVALRSGDILTLLPISPEFANAVTLQGAVAGPARHPWRAGMRLLDLIPDTQVLMTQEFFRRQNRLVQVDPTANEPRLAQDSRLAQDRAGVEALQRQLDHNLDAINWDYAVIERLDRTTLERRILPFNLGLLVKQRDPQHNLALQAGDVVTIFNQTDLRLPQQRQARMVRIEGEVATPGVYALQPGETLPQLIRRIGGLTPHAYVFGIQLKREEVRRQQQQNLERTLDRLEAKMQAQASAQLANLQGADGNRAAVLLEAQREAQRQQIARLRTMRSTGRVALELEPQQATLAALPSLPLEHGDHIVVPSVPGFVAAVGAVNNENTFVFRPGRTVADVLRLAGPTPDADVNNAFVLRADGTVVAAHDRQRWFGGGLDALALMPGDTLVVPQLLDRETGWNLFVRNARDITQILANLGLGLAALRSL